MYDKDYSYLQINTKLNKIKKKNTKIINLYY